MLNNKGKLITITPGDTIVQIIPDFDNADKRIKTTSIVLPDIEFGYIMQASFCLIDEYMENYITDTCKFRRPVLCGVIECRTLLFNEKIRRDILDELYRDGVIFDLYIRQRTYNNENEQDGPKVIKSYHDCRFYRQELGIPEVGLIDTFRYHFTNSDEPWEISLDRINELRPPNQYVYDYAVSKAIKNLQYPINDVCKALNNIDKKTVTASEYIALVTSKSE